MPRRDDLDAEAVAAALLGAFLTVRDAGLGAVVFFLELRARGAAFFVELFLLDEALVLVFFLVTFFLESFRLADDFPALETVFLVVAFFAEVFFLEVFFFEAFLAEVFFVDPFLDGDFFDEAFLVVFFDDFFTLVFFLLAAFFPGVVLADFFLEVAFRVLADDLLAGRLRDEAELVFFETLFLAAAFFFGMR